MGKIDWCLIGIKTVSDCFFFYGFKYLLGCIYWVFRVRRFSDNAPHGNPPDGLRAGDGVLARGSAASHESGMRAQAILSGCGLRSTW